MQVPGPGEEVGMGGRVLGRGVLGEGSGTYYRRRIQDEHHDM